MRTPLLLLMAILCAPGPALAAGVSEISASSPALELSGYFDRIRTGSGLEVPAHPGELNGYLDRMIQALREDLGRPLRGAELAGWEKDTRLGFDRRLAQARTEAEAACALAFDRRKKGLFEWLIRPKRPAVDEASLPRRPSWLDDPIPELQAERAYWRELLAQDEAAAREYLAASQGLVGQRDELKVLAEIFDSPERVQEFAFERLVASGLFALVADEALLERYREADIPALLRNLDHLGREASGEREQVLDAIVGLLTRVLTAGPDSIEYRETRELLLAGNLTPGARLPVLPLLWEKVLASAKPEDLREEVAALIRQGSYHFSGKQRNWRLKGIREALEEAARTRAMPAGVEGLLEELRARGAGPSDLRLVEEVEAILANPNGYKPGDRFQVNRWFWADVAGSSKREFRGVAYRDHVGLQAEGILTLVEVRPGEKTAVLEYFRGGRESGGTEARAGDHVELSFEQLAGGDLTRLSPVEPEPKGARRGTGASARDKERALSDRLR